MTNYEFYGAKEAFLMSSFIATSLAGLLWLSGLAPLSIIVGGLFLVFLAIIIYFFA